MEKLDVYFQERLAQFHKAQSLGLYPQDGEAAFLEGCLQERKFLEARLEVPRPLRLQQELEFWYTYMETDLEEEEDPIVKKWIENCLPTMRQALNLLVRGKSDEAFLIVAAMADDMDRYGPLPVSLEFDHILWCDI